MRQGPAAGAVAIIVLAAVLHIILLASTAQSTHSLSLANTLSAIGLVLGLTALIALLRPPFVGLGVLALPLAGICALATGLGTEANRAPLSWPLQAHVLLSVIAYAVLTLGAGLAILMAIQHRRLRQHRPGGVTSLLPPLETTERSLFTTIGVGFALLSLAVFSGLVFVDNVFAQHLVHKTVLSIFAWVIFAVLLLGRWRFGWRGQTAVTWTLSGFGGLVLAYFGSRIVLELLLGRQWG